MLRNLTYIESLRRALATSCAAAIVLVGSTAQDRTDARQQTRTSTFFGVVFGDTGAPFDGALVIATNELTGAEWTDTTSGDGVYRLRDLEPGPFLIQILASGQLEIDLHHFRIPFATSTNLVPPPKFIARTDIETAWNLRAQALASCKSGQLSRARELAQRAVSIAENVYGSTGLGVLFYLKALLWICQKQVDTEMVRHQLDRILEIYTSVYGSDDPALTSPLREAINTSEEVQDVKRATALRERLVDLVERVLAVPPLVESERSILGYLDALSEDTYDTVSLSTQMGPRDEAATRLALTTILRRKGRALAAIQEWTSGVMQRAPTEASAIVARLSDTRRRLSELYYGGPESRDNTTPETFAVRRSELEGTIRYLEDELARRYARFGPTIGSISIDAIQQAIPPGAALVEYVYYLPSSIGPDQRRRYGEARYAAYVLTRRAGPTVLDLGDAAKLDQAVVRWRGALRDPHRSDVRALGRDVDEGLLRSVRRTIGRVEHLLIAPDATLNLVPFGALVEESSQYVVERHEVTYLTSGRDLLDIAVPSRSRQEPLVIADPEYGPITSDADERDILLKAADSTHTRISFPDLPGTAREADALRRVVEGAKVLTRALATETAVKSVAGPAFLHIASHGYFLEDTEIGTTGRSSRAALTHLLDGDGRNGVRLQEFSPVLRAGIGLAGANRRRSGADDGILTALEVAGLDLQGTELVVLSACNTGLGEIRDGQGVYGMRYALVLAGSETQVLSLWAVSDATTADLMADYYKGLRGRMGRCAALRRAQLKVLTKPKRRHPYFWAAFIQCGNWEPLTAPF